MNFEACLPVVLQHEGGFSANPADPGGATNLGVTIHTLSNWLGHPATVADVKALTAETVAQIYKAWFWSPVSGDNLPAGVDLCVFDDAVNTGPGSAAKRLQKAADVTADGAIGPGTLAAVHAMPVGALIDALATLRSAYYESLPTFDRFGRGWLNRVAATTATAHQMANA